MTIPSLSKFIDSIATCVLTGACLFVTFGVIAVLDEILRLPFYRSIPAGALLINSAILFLLLRPKSVTMVFEQVRGWSAADLFRPSTIFAPRDYEGKRTHGSLDQVLPDRSSVRIPSAQEIETALKKVHSVAWGFPVSDRSGGSVGQEESINYEARQ